MNVFTYGSLMFPEVWKIVTGREFDTIEATLHGYSTFRVRGAVFPGITQVSDDAVRGLVYLNVDEASVDRLDRFEGDLYERRSVIVNCSDGRQLPADAYVIAESQQHELTAELWTADWFVSSGGLADFIARYQGFSRLGGAG